MDERDSHCPYLLSSETTAKGTGLAESAGKEDPVEIYPKMFVKLKKAGGMILSFHVVFSCFNTHNFAENICSITFLLLLHRWSVAYGLHPWCCIP